MIHAVRKENHVIIDALLAHGADVSAPNDVSVQFQSLRFNACQTHARHLVASDMLNLILAGKHCVDCGSESMSRGICGEASITRG